MLKNRKQDLQIILNGGIKTIKSGLENTKNFNLDGFMIGREAYQNPFILSEVDYMIFKEEITEKTQIRKHLLDASDLIIQQFERWWDKYAIPLAQIDSDLQESELVMKSFLRELGYEKNYKKSNL